MLPSTTRHRWLVAAALLAAGSPTLAVADDFADLVAAERAFAADAAARNVRDAFLASAADDGVVFSSGPRNAKAYWSARPVTAMKLEWAPEAAEIAASGDLGYTYGPWRLTPEGADKPAGFGHFFTVWQKQPDGTWKWLADKGIGHDEQPLPTEVVRRGQLGLAPAAGTAKPAPALLDELRQADLLPVGQVTPTVIAPDFLRFRPGEPPRTVTESPALAANPATSFESNLVISAAGDLAATWGGSPGGVSWVRVWRRAGVGDPPGQPWRLVIDVADVVEPPGPTQ
jgi:ketosteroid isomerase-like protein